MLLTHQTPGQNGIRMKLLVCQISCLSLSVYGIKKTHFDPVLTYDLLLYFEFYQQLNLCKLQNSIIYDPTIEPTIPTICSAQTQCEIFINFSLVFISTLYFTGEK